MFWLIKLRFVSLNCGLLEGLKEALILEYLIHKDISNHFPATWTPPSIFLFWQWGWSFQLWDTKETRVGICTYLSINENPYSEGVGMDPGWFVQIIRVLTESRRDEVVFVLEILCLGDMNKFLEHTSFVFLDPSGMHIKAQSWTALKSFNSVLF